MLQEMFYLVHIRLFKMRFMISLGMPGNCLFFWILARAYVTLPALSRKPCRHANPISWQGLGEAEALPSLCFCPFRMAQVAHWP